MFEATLLNGNILKKIVEAIKDVVNDVNLDVSAAGKTVNSTKSLSVCRNLFVSDGRVPCCFGEFESQHGRLPQVQGGHTHGPGT